MATRTAKQKMPLAVADSNAIVSTPMTAAGVAVKPKPKAPVKSTKRKAADIEDPQDLPEIDDDDPRLQYITDNCNQVRTKIRNFINSGEMKIGEFQKAIDVSANAYGRFMGQTGPEKGFGCDTYQNAFIFFKKRELQGIKAPKKKVKKAEEDQKNDVSGIHLDGESDGEVEVYDTCDEVRKKINAYLKDPKVSQAGFLREIAKTFPDGRKLHSKSLSDFLGKKGPSAGNTSGVFYAAYVFFEKMRIRDGKPKSKFRLEMEDIWDGCDFHGTGKAGFDTKTPSNRGYIVPIGTQPYIDKYGRVRC